MSIIMHANVTDWHRLFFFFFTVLHAIACCTWLIRRNLMFSNWILTLTGSSRWLWCQLYNCFGRSHLLSYLLKQIITWNSTNSSFHFLPKIYILFHSRIQNDSVNAFVKLCKICENCLMDNQMLVKVTRNYQLWHRQLIFPHNWIIRF